MHERGSIAALALAAAFFAAGPGPAGPGAARAQGGPAARVTCAEVVASQAPFPAPPTQLDASCAALPVDLSGEIAQVNFDLFAWMSFVAANWPVDPATCAADPSVSILAGPPQPTWLSYATDTSVFVPPGQTPAPWCRQGSGTAQNAQGALPALATLRAERVARLPPKVRALAAQHPQVALFLSHDAKGAGLLHDRAALAGAGADPISGILQATGQPVVDQNGRFARYSVHMNLEEYAYLTANRLWTSAGQQGIGLIAFPASSRASGAVGSLEAKAAWKVLGAGDDPNRFLTQQAIVYNDASGDPSPGPNPVTVGLAGLHLIRKTQSSSEWIWATFAQVDNDTTSFFNPACTNCTPNQPPTLTPYQELDAAGQPLNPPTQVVPVVQPEPSAQRFNATFQGLLRGTPFSNYRLISAQWLGEAGTEPKPAQLGNSVIETYVTPGPTTYGCLQCHGNATAWPSGKASDRSFIINAQQ